MGRRCQRYQWIDYYYYGINNGNVHIDTYERWPRAWRNLAVGCFKLLVAGDNCDYGRTQARSAAVTIMSFSIMAILLQKRTGRTFGLSSDDGSTLFVTARSLLTIMAITVTM